MNLEHLTEIITLVLAISLATERLVLAVKTILEKISKWQMWGYRVVLVKTIRALIGQKTPADQNLEISIAAGLERPFIIQVLAFLCALFTVGWLDPEGKWDPWVSIDIAGQPIDLWIVALLATGGSSFWKNILGYTKSVRNIQITNEQRNRTLSNLKIKTASARLEIEEARATQEKRRALEA